MEVEVLDQHGGGGWHLLLIILLWIRGAGLEVQRHLVVDARHDLHQLHGAAVFLQHLAQRLDEPRAVGGVPPGVVAWREIMYDTFNTEFIVFNIHPL